MKARLLAERTQQLTPTKGTEQLSQNTKGQRCPHPFPTDIMTQRSGKDIPVHATVHPPQNATCQGKSNQAAYY